MTTVRLRKLPNGGTSSPTIRVGVSLQDFATQQNIVNRDIVVNGQSVARNDWPMFQLNGGERITATTSVKGA